MMNVYNNANELLLKEIDKAVKMGIVATSFMIKKADDLQMSTLLEKQKYDYRNLSTKIKNNGYFQAEYLTNIELAFSICSVCISRAGSNTVFELLALKIPSILIPLPKGNSRGDQILNAEYFQKLGLVSVLPQNVLTPKSLVYAVNSTYSNRLNLRRHFDSSPITDSSRQISRLLIESIN